MSNRKAELLSLLRERADYVSGQELCRHFQVSRTAVWKLVNQLKKDGYQIDAVQNKGYFLADATGVYGAEELRSLIQTKWAGQNLIFLPKTGSTNAVAKQQAENGAVHGTVVAADCQTAGRGRRGRSWESPAGKNIYFTIILKPELPVEKVSMLTLVMAHAAALAIRSLTGEDCRIKWPNDLVLEGRKICGILTELSLERDYVQYLVTGVGINVGRQEFEPQLQDKAASLEEITGSSISRSRLLAEVLRQYEASYERFLAAGDLRFLLEEYNALLVNRDRRVCVLDPQGEFEGTALGINPAGELLVETQDGKVTTVYAGEVSVRGIYGYV